MSNTIVFDRQVLKTPTGYTFVILHGDSTCTVGSGRNEKIARGWHCWLLDKTESEVADYFEQFGDSFIANGKVIENDGLKRWGKNGIKNAKTLEEIRAEKPSQSLRVGIRVYDEKKGVMEDGYVGTELDAYVKTTEQLVKWCKKANRRIAHKKKSETLFINTAFVGREPLKLSAGNLKGPVLAKRGQNYVSELAKTGAGWKKASANIEEALEFGSLAEAQQACGPYHDLLFVSATLKEKARAKGQYVIEASDSCGRAFITRMSEGDMLLKNDMESAKVYTKQGAQAYIRKHKHEFEGLTLKAILKS